MSLELFSSIHNRKNFFLIAGNSAWLLGDKLLRVGLGVVVGAVIARYLGPDSYGKLSYVFAYVLLLGSVVAFGLDGVVVRDLVTHEADTHKILGTAFLIKYCCAITVFILGNLLFGMLDLNAGDLWSLIVIASGALLFHPLDVVDLRFQSRLDGRAIVTARSTALVLVSAFKLLLVVVGAPLIFFAATPTIEAGIVGMLLVLIYSKKEGALYRWRFDRGRAVIMVRTAAPLAISSIFVVGTMQIDKLMLASISGHHAVGLYSAASLLSTAWYMVPVIVGASVAPFLTRLYEIDPVEYGKKLQDVFSALTFAAVCVGVFLVLLSKPLVTLIFGEDYSSSAIVLVIHVWAGLFVAHVSVRTRAFLIEGKTKLVALFSVLLLATNIILNLLLIHRYQAVGAAWASLISWGLCALIFPMCLNRSRVFAWMLLQSFRPSFWMRALTGSAKNANPIS